ncbi:MAG: hypothetical protein WBZ29_17930 [Methanocella sp.]
MGLPVHASSPHITAIKQGTTTSMALDTNGNLWIWGSNFAGEGGYDGTVEDMSTYYIVTPIIAKGVSSVIDMDGGQFFSIALGKNHTVWTWGDAGNGQLGRGGIIDGHSRNDATPGIVPNITTVKMVSVGNDFSAILLENGTVWTWGNNYVAQLGDGATYTPPIDFYMGRSHPGMVVNLNNVRDVYAGERNVIAITNDGELWIWGASSVCLMGEYGKTHRSYLINYGRVSTPIHLDNLHNIKSVAVGEYFAVALSEDGNVWTWGSNFKGQLGNQKIEDSYDPVAVQGLSNIVQVSAGIEHAMALSKDGTVWSWGSNQYGQLGDGTTTDSNGPVRLDLPRIVAISADRYNSMALDEDGNVWTWGDNNFGQIGNGKHGSGMDSIYSPMPMKVSFPDITGETADITPNDNITENAQNVSQNETSTVQPGATPQKDHQDPASPTPESETTISPSPGKANPIPGFGYVACLSMLMIAVLGYVIARK